MLVEAELPDDPALLQAMLVEARGEISRRDQEITTLRTVGAEADADIERLTGIIAALQRHRFGARSEQLSQDQLSLAFEETEAALARVAAKLESVTPDREPKPRHVNRGRLPAHLERVEQVIGVESTACARCGGALHIIGEGRQVAMPPAWLWTAGGSPHLPPRAARRRARELPGAGHAPPAQRLPLLRGRARPSTSLIETCKLNDINPHIWLADTLTRLATGHSATALGQLMPWNYAAAVG